VFNSFDKIYRQVGEISFGSQGARLASVKRLGSSEVEVGIIKKE